MKPEQQQIAIAEACGWTEIHERHVAHLDHKNWCGACRGKEGPRWLDGYSVLPDYLSDLNAMHEAEKVLTEEQHRRFSWHLVQVTDNNYHTWSAFEYETLSVWEMSLGDVQACLRATAAQRAEAFLRTLNLWTEL